MPSRFDITKKKEKVRVELIVHGNVQVVSYRYLVMDIAEDLRISGKIWNRSDKTVGIIAEGEKSRIKKFIDQIKIRPLTHNEIARKQRRGEFIPPQPVAKVEKIEGRNKFLPYSGKYKKFEIITDNQNVEMINSLRTASQVIEKLRNDMYYNFQALHSKYEVVLQEITETHELQKFKIIQTKMVQLEKGPAVGLLINLGKAPLILLKAKKGYVMCGYLDMATANKLGDIAGMVTGVKKIEDTLTGKIVKVSEKAKKKKLRVGMTGRAFLNALM